MEPFTKQVKVVSIEQPDLLTLFATHIATTTFNGYTLITFYAALPPQGIESSEDMPEEIEARSVAKVVVPEGQWQQLLDNALDRRGTPANSEEGVDE